MGKLEQESSQIQNNLFLDPVRREAPFIVYFILFFAGQTRIIEQIINQTHERSFKIFLNSLKIWENCEDQMEQETVNELIKNR